MKRGICLAATAKVKGNIAAGFRARDRRARLPAKGAHRLAHRAHHARHVDQPAALDLKKKMKILRKTAFSKSKSIFFQNIQKITISKF